jgi:hypothetical protein
MSAGGNFWRMVKDLWQTPKANSYRKKIIHTTSERINIRFNRKIKL